MDWQGYEDLNDHEHLRHDPMFGIAVALESDHPRCSVSREEHPESFGKRYTSKGSFEQRYVKFRLPQEVEHLLVELFIEQMQTVPKQIILDMDVSDDPGAWNSGASVLQWLLRP